MRVSTEGQATEGYSLAEQERRIRAYAESNGWELVETFIDAGISGAKEDRPALGRLLSALPDLDRVIVLKLDRIGRNAQHTLALFERFERQGVSLVSVLDGFDTATTTGRMVPKLLAVLAEWERDLIAERVASAAEARARTGRSHGGPRTYGYRSEGGILRVVAHEAEVVRRIFREFAAGASQLSIARDLTRDGVPPARGFGGSWHQSSVGRILHSQTYLGRTVLKGRAFEGRHEAIVPEALWSDAARLLSASKGKEAGRGRPSRRFLLQGLLACGRCGATMIVRSGDRADAYACHTRHRDPQRCSQPPMPRALIDEVVLDYFVTVGLDVEATKTSVERSAGAKVAEVAALREEAERESVRAAGRLAKVERDYLGGDLTAAAYSPLVERLLADQEAAEAEAERLREREGEITEAAEALGAGGDVIERLAEIRAAVSEAVRDAEGVEAARAALRRLFSGFTLREVGAAEGEVGPTDLMRVHRHEDGSVGIYLIEPTVRPEALLPEGEADSGGLWPSLLNPADFPRLRREPLEMAENNYPNVKA